MTEARGPSGAAGTATGPRPGGGPSAAVGTTATSPKPAAARRPAEPRRPYHVGVFLGLSAGLYAVSLAGVTALQSASDQALAAAHAPTVTALETLTSGHDELDARLGTSAARYQAAAEGYQRAADSLTALEGTLDRLATSVGKVSGVASSLPSRVTLPSLPKSVSIAAPAPAVHATTGASGKP